MSDSPSTNHYVIGKGRWYFKKTGETDYRHMGNSPEAELALEIEELDHFSSMEGTRSKDKTVVLEKTATLRLVLEEWTAPNLELALLGSTTDGSGGDKIIEIYDVNAVTGEMKFEGSNEVGPQSFVYFPNVSIKPSGTPLGFISEEWGTLELDIDVLVDANGSFGTWQLNQHS